MRDTDDCHEYLLVDDLIENPKVADAYSPGVVVPGQLAASMRTRVVLEIGHPAEYPSADLRVELADLSGSRSRELDPKARHATSARSSSSDTR
jgi:hypothetical protein